MDFDAGHSLPARETVGRTIRAGAEGTLAAPEPLRHPSCSSACLCAMLTVCMIRLMP